MAEVLQGIMNSIEFTFAKRTGFDFLADVLINFTQTSSHPGGSGGLAERAVGVRAVHGVRPVQPGDPPGQAREGRPGTDRSAGSIGQT